MYFTHKFRDPSVKREVVIANTNEMIFSYFWSTMQVRYPAFTGMTLSDIETTKKLISEWVEANFEQANLTTLADIISRLVDDYEENNVDRAADKENYHV